MTACVESPPPLLGTSGSAVFSDDGAYRYRLDRTWGDSGRHAVWLMLNPSTADALADDPTIRRCAGFSRSWGLDGLTVVNLFALRATDPRALARHPDPVGPENDEFIRRAIGPCSVVVAAWGAQRIAAARADTWRRALTRTADVLCLGTTKDGEPRHPLYVRADQPLASLPFRRQDRQAASPHELPRAPGARVKEDDMFGKAPREVAAAPEGDAARSALAEAQEMNHPADRGAAVASAGQRMTAVREREADREAGA